MTIQILTDPEIEIVHKSIDSAYYISKAGNNLARNRLLLDFLLEAGLRVGELAQLMWGDVYTGQNMNNCININAGTTKTNTGRQIPISKRLAESLAVYTASQGPMIAIPPLDHVFSAADKTNHLTTRQIRRIVTEICRHALRRGVWPHMLRHTFATRCMKVTSIRVVQAMLGHASLTSTQVYTHPNNNDMQEAINAI